ncbi:MAG: hypothetical protein IRY95_00115 [Clostridia bacterium]|nr:hypothetical protein [Clostridia bacterium]
MSEEAFGLEGLAEVIRGNATRPDRTKWQMGADEARAAAQEVLQRLLEQDREAYPIVAEGYGLRFLFDPDGQFGGGRRVYVDVWEGSRWVTVGEVCLGGTSG